MFKNKKYLSIACYVILVIMIALAVTGCGLGPRQNGPPTDTQIEQQTDLGTTIQTEILDLFVICMNSGNGYLNQPSQPDSNPTTSSSLIRNISRPGDGWTGPDSQGWYTRTQQWGYAGYWYTERYRYIPDEKAYEYQTELSYDDADGSFSYKTQYRSATNSNNLLDGYYFMITDNDGYGDQSHAEWKFYYTNFNKQTGAGHFEWWFGANSLSSTNNISPHCYLKIDATSIGDGMLRLHVIFYDDTGYPAYDWEYDCYYTPDNTGL